MAKEFFDKLLYEHSISQGIINRKQNHFAQVPTGSNKPYNIAFGTNFKIKNYKSLIPFDNLLKDSDGAYPSLISDYCTHLQKIFDLSDSVGKDKNTFITKLLTVMRDNDMYKEGAHQGTSKRYTGLSNKLTNSVLETVVKLKEQRASDSTVSRILDLFPELNKTRNNGSTQYLEIFKTVPRFIDEKGEFQIDKFCSKQISSNAINEWLIAD